MREIAILRALGATRGRILTLICVEAGLIGLAGSILGLIVGHLLGAVGSGFVEKLVGEGFNWLNVSREEWIYLIAVVLLSTAAGLIPALKAYRTPVATNLVAG
jgi:putative ABC transport system permease protein